MIARSLLLLVVLALSGCAAFTELAHLYQVEFAFDRVSDVRIAGVPVAGGYGDLSATDLARLGAAVASRSVPLDLVVHVRGTNPKTNTVNARMPQVAWTFFVEDREIVHGTANESYLFEPGKPQDVAIPVRFNAYDKFGGSTKSLFELALAVAGVEGYSKEIRLDLMPTIETSVGPIHYPTPISVRRTVGG